jgi:hypothetical protein
MLLVVRIALACVALLVLTPGCGLLSSRHPSSPDSSVRTKVLVEVESHNWSDITVYLLAGGLPQRLGMVSALSSASFDLSVPRAEYERRRAAAGASRSGEAVYD